MKQQSKKQKQFVEYLCRLAAGENRAPLAALRRGLGKPPGTTPEMFRYVEPLAPQDYRADDYYLVAALFALHPENTATGNLGTTLAALRQQGGHDGEDSLEKRFVALLNAHGDDLPEHLRHAISLARSKAVPVPVPVNWSQLLYDLHYWDHEDRFIQRQWAREYWGRSEVVNAETEEPS